MCLTRLLCLEQVLWALCVYVEAVSVLPQLRMMQKAKVRQHLSQLRSQQTHFLKHGWLFLEAILQCAALCRTPAGDIQAGLCTYMVLTPHQDGVGVASCGWAD